MTQPLDVVKTLQAAADRRDREAVLALVTPDLEYHYHVGSKPLQGVEKLGRFLDNYWGRTKDNVWKIETYAQSGDKLLMEGWEEYTDTTSNQRVVNRYMGIMEFRDGRIARWRDYFQMDRPAASG
jgi:ketosteroid isomerase-like protein